MNYLSVSTYFGYENKKLIGEENLEFEGLVFIEDNVFLNL